MSLPPEHLRIKRRREEEPVETLYIQQPDTYQHQSKRRFTDFVFQRVIPNATRGTINAPVPSALPAARSVSTGASGMFTGTGLGPGTTRTTDHKGVPIVKSTLPADVAPEKQRETEREIANSSHAAAVAAAAAAPTVVVPDATKDPGGLIGESALNKAPVPASASASASVKTSGSATSLVKPSLNRSVQSSSCTPSAARSLRRFHLATPLRDRSTSACLHPGSASSRLLQGVSGSGGIRKMGSGTSLRRNAREAKAGASPVAIVIENLMQAPQSEGESRASVEELASQLGSTSVKISAPSTGTTPMPPVPPRKRHVVNEAERRWRTDRTTSKHSLHLQQVQAAGGKTAEDTQANPDSWNQESDKLADELERIAMEMTGDVYPVGGKQTTAENESGGPSATRARLQPSPDQGEQREEQIKPKLKYQPRSLRRQRGSSAEPSVPPTHQILPAKMETGEFEPPPDAIKSGTTVSMEEDEEDYIYDEFIRRPVHEVLSDLQLHNRYLPDDTWVNTGMGASVPRRDIGIVVITHEDAHYWDELAEEEDEGGWDEEDGDSNAEDNPANEYPDEELDYDDEFDNTNAAYRYYRRGASDDEEFDEDDEDGSDWWTYRNRGRFDDYDEEDEDRNWY